MWTKCIIIDMYAGKNREEGEAFAKEISLEIMKRIEAYVDGYYIMTPFNRTHLVADIIKGKN